MLKRRNVKPKTIRPEQPETPERPICPEQVEAYRRDGVVCLRQAVSPHWMAKIRAGVSRAIDSPSLFSRMGSAPDDGYNMEIFLWKRDDDLRDVIFGSSLVHLARQMMRAQRVHFFYDQLFAKKAGTLTPTPWHHDLTFWPLHGDQICSIWIPTQRVRRESSGLEFVAGSHRWPNRWKAVGPPNGREEGLLPTASRELVDPAHEDVPPVENLREKHDLLSWDMEPGDVLAFHPLTLHGSEGNASSKDRAAIAFRFTGDDVSYHPTPYTFPIFYRHGRKVGGAMGGPMFPQLLPNAIPQECKRRDRGAETPSPVELARFLVRPIARKMGERRRPTIAKRP